MFKKVIFFFVFMNAVIGGGHVLAASNYEIEPNDTVQQATPITVNQKYFGTLSDYYDNDYYNFTVNKPGNIKISMPNSTESSWYVRIYNSKGEELNDFSTQYGQFATGSTTDQIGLPAGTYTVIISNYSNAYKVPYSFNLQFVESSLYEQERNDDIPSATSIVLNNQYQGVLSSSNDNDYYAFKLDKPGNILISLPNRVDSSWYIRIYDSKGKELNDFSTKYGQFAIGNTTDQIGLQAGSYYLSVSNYSEARKVPYLLDIRFDQSSFFEKESNNSIQEASAIQLNYKYQGVLSSSNDTDYYAVRVDKNSYLSLSLPNLTDSSWYVRVYDQKGKEIMDFGTEYGSFVSGITTNQFGVSSGTYYISISNYSEARKVPYSFVLSSRKFNDLNVDHWAHNEITYLYNKGIITGYNTNNTFRPNNNVTKAQAAIMISRALNLNLKNVSNPGYKDVPTSFHAYKEIAAVTNAGIFPKTTNFNPNSALTRGDMAMALVEAYNLTGTYNGKITDVSNPTTLKYVQALAANNITNIYSDNTFKPNNSVTRAQFSAFFTRILSEEFRN
ncbi:S-layer homology domain-containing protein [Peribacillus sp. JNUCC 23]